MANSQKPSIVLIDSHSSLISDLFFPSGDWEEAGGHLRDDRKSRTLEWCVWRWRRTHQGKAGWSPNLEDPRSAKWGSDEAKTDQLIMKGQEPKGKPKQRELCHGKTQVLVKGEKSTEEHSVHRTGDLHRESLVSSLSLVM